MSILSVEEASNVIALAASPTFKKRKSKEMSTSIVDINVEEELSTGIKKPDTQEQYDTYLREFAKFLLSDYLHGRTFFIIITLIIIRNWMREKYMRENLSILRSMPAWRNGLLV